MNHADARLRNAEVVRRASGGEAVEALAAEYDITPAYVYSLIRISGAGLPIPQCSRRVMKRRAIIAELHTLGLAGGAVVRLLNISRMTFYNDARICGLKFPYDAIRWRVGGRNSQQRAARMAALYRTGMTLQQIGDKYGLTRERVRQLMAKHENMSQKGGGQHIKAVANKQKASAAKDARYLATHGCTFAQYAEAREVGRRMQAQGIGVYRTLARAFASQRSAAKGRNIAWELTFWQWWTIWQDSGKWDQRGRSRDAYVMSRFGDTGPYAPGNIYIGTLAENSSIQPNNPYRKDHPDHASIAYERRQSLEQRLAPHPGKKSDLPRGVTRHHRGGYMAQAQLGGKNTYLGTFKTPEAAHEAYVAAVMADVNDAHKNSEAA